MRFVYYSQFLQPVKPHLLSSLGVMGVQLGPEFKKYLDQALEIVMLESQAEVDRVSKILIKPEN